MSIYVFIIFCSGSKFVVFVFTKQRNKSSFLVSNFDSLQSNLPIHENRTCTFYNKTLIYKQIESYYFMGCNLDVAFCDFARRSSTGDGVVFLFYTTFKIFLTSLIQLPTLKLSCIWSIAFISILFDISLSPYNVKASGENLSLILSDLAIIETTKEPGFTIFINSQKRRS